MALAEIVEGESDPMYAELGRDLVSGGDVANHLVFGNLDDDPGPTVPTRTGVEYERSDLQAEKRRDRDIDGETHRMAGGSEVTGVAERRAQRIFGEDDEVRL